MMPVEPVSRRQQEATAGPSNRSPYRGKLKAEWLGLWKSLGPTFVISSVIFKPPKKTTGTVKVCPSLNRVEARHGRDGVVDWSSI